MKKIISLTLILVMTFPVFALDFIVMNNGDSYIGNIQEMGTDDTVIILTLEGITEIVSETNIKSISNVDTDNSGTTDSVNIQTQSTNNAANIIGTSLSLTENEITYVPRVKGLLIFSYVAPKCIFNGIEYNVETGWGLKSQIKEFIGAIRMSHPTLSNDIELLVKDLEKKLANRNMLYLVGIGVGIVGTVGGAVLAIEGLKDMLIIPPYSQTKYIVGITLEITSMAVCLGLTRAASFDLQNEVKSIVKKFNMIY